MLPGNSAVVLRESPVLEGDSAEGLLIRRNETVLSVCTTNGIGSVSVRGHRARGCAQQRHLVPCDVGQLYSAVTIDQEDAKAAKGNADE